MTIRLRDEAIVLEPATAADPYTEQNEPDWQLEPLSATPTRCKIEPLSSTEDVLTSETIVSRHRGYLGPEWDGIVTPTFRIRWDSEDYRIDGDLERFKTRGAVRYLAFALKRIEG